MTVSDPPLTSQMLLRAYMAGIFPMAESRDDPEIFWVEPKRRGILPLDGFHISRSLARQMRKGGYKVALNTRFAQVVNACADRKETWINSEIFQLYNELHTTGHAHSFEVWQDETLIGGVYGVAICGAFFGESMFSHRPNASKIALAHLTDHLAQCGFTLFDTQFITPHLTTLGAVEISRDNYRDRLRDALRTEASILSQPVTQNVHSVLQRNTQTS